jgi:hypothetical protein
VASTSEVLSTQLNELTSDGESNELVSLTFKTKKLPKRQKYTVGDILKSRAVNGKSIFARLFAIDPPHLPLVGPIVGVYDSLGMVQRDIETIVSQPLIVRPFPIHREFLEKRAWIVVGNRPLTEEEQRVPFGPLRIAGTNEQLDASNYYYGLAPAASPTVEQLLIRKKE